MTIILIIILVAVGIMWGKKAAAALVLAAVGVFLIGLLGLLLVVLTHS